MSVPHTQYFHYFNGQDMTKVPFMIIDNRFIYYLVECKLNVYTFRRYENMNCVTSFTLIDEKLRVFITCLKIIIQQRFLCS